MPALIPRVRARLPLRLSVVAPWRPLSLRLSSLLLAIWPFSLPLPALADGEPEDADASAAPIEEIVVTSSPLGRTADELVQPVEVLSGAELDRLRRGTLGETLEQQPGVASTDFGAGAGRPVIRGLAGPRVEMLENGMSAMDVSDLSPDHAVAISPAQARQVEIIKGPATLLYGNSASGGVVNVDNGRLPTRRIDGLHGAFDGYYGSSGDEGSLSGEANYGSGPHLLHLDLGWREAQDYDIHGAAGVDGSGSRERLANSQLRAKSGATSYSHISDDGDVYGVSGSRFETTYGLPVEDEAFIDMRQSRVDAQALLRQPFTGFESLKFRLGGSDYQHTEFEAPQVPGTVFKNEQYQGRVEAVHAPLAGFRGVVGVQLNWRDFSALGDEAYVPSVVSRQYGLFFLEEKPHRLGKLEFGARIERDTTRPQGNRADRGFTPLSVSLGSSFDIGEASHLKLYATRNERSPVAEELYAYGPHGATATFERGNPDAGKEVASNIELGFDHHDGRWTFNGSVYYNRIRNYLYLAEVDAGLSADGSGLAQSDGAADRVDADGTFAADGEMLLVDYRQANARLYGVEAELNYALLVDGPLTLDARLFGDTVRAELAHGGNLPRIPPLRYGLGVDGSYRRYSGALSLTRVEQQSDIATLETRTDGYTLLNADLGYRLFASDDGERSASVYLRGSNLLDAELRRATSFIKDAVPAPGRAVFAGLRFTL